MVNEKEVLYTFNRELCERLELSGMTYRDLAFKARCAPSRVESYLRGNNFPNLWTLTLMAEALDCCIDDLLGYKNRRKRLRTDSPFKKFISEFDFALHFKECLKARMEDQRVSQETLAELTCLNKYNIYRYLSPGYPMPHVAQTLNICDALDCTPSDLLGY